MEKSPTSNVKGIFRRFSLFSKDDGHITKKQSLWSLKSSLSEDKDKKDIAEKFEFEAKEIPLTPCSVLQIKDYIQTDMLKEAYLNLLSLRLELRLEQSSLGERECHSNLDNKKKDLDLLYDALMDKMSAIVRNSSGLPSCNKELLVYVSCIILEEEKKQGEPGAMEGWREAWKEAVLNGVRDTLKNVPLDSREQNASWLAVHLGLLGKAVVEDLERVKTELLSSYPADFNVLETYVSCHHEAVGEHLKRLLLNVTELKDYYALLDFIIHRYPSDLREQQRALIMEEDLNKIKTSYCHCQKEDFKLSLEKCILLETEVWKKKKSPERTEDGFLTSKIHVDICQLIAGYYGNLQKIDENLGKSVVSSCLEELNPFFTRFEKEFSQQIVSLLNSDLLDYCLWVEYHITYINSFSSLKENLQSYKDSCSAQVEKEVDGLTQRLRQCLMDHFKSEVKPYMDGMMTKKWLKSDADFNEVVSRIETYSGLCKSMRAPSAQMFVDDVHYYVAKEYVSQLMKKKYSCKKNKNEDAAIKIKKQWNELRKLFVEMGSSLKWLYPLGNYLSDIIGMEIEKNIKDLLNPLVTDYPDISKKHLLAVLSFRDNGFSLEKNSVINRFTVLKRDAGNTSHQYSFFTDIE
ncbi:exocyst complex component 3-like protein 4 [Puntigrus tetrazona]|uniref:exocyst complex component 3-like protein 4 n=1 Tax=Puntigrus tetrazona TaxID=1606681 RepID=UPI001C8A1485|nr:exocyst complex component 3-like protein 4 [Puntigrus tetrazona]